MYVADSRAACSTPVATAIVRAASVGPPSAGAIASAVTPSVTLSVAALIALGPISGIVKKLAELLDYGRHHTEARAGGCLLNWGYSATFGKGQLFVSYSLGTAPTCVSRAFYTG